MALWDDIVNTVSSWINPAPTYTPMDVTTNLHNYTPVSTPTGTQYSWSAPTVTASPTNRVAPRTPTYVNASPTYRQPYVAPKSSAMNTYTGQIGGVIAAAQYNPYQGIAQLKPGVQEYVNQQTVNQPYSPAAKLYSKIAPEFVGAAQAYADSQAIEAINAKYRQYGEQAAANAKSDFPVLDPNDPTKAYKQSKPYPNLNWEEIQKKWQEELNTVTSRQGQYAGGTPTQQAGTTQTMPTVKPMTLQTSGLPGGFDPMAQLRQSGANLLNAIMPTGQQATAPVVVQPPTGNMPQETFWTPDGKLIGTAKDYFTAEWFDKNLKVVVGADGAIDLPPALQNGDGTSDADFIVDYFADKTIPLSTLLGVKGKDVARQRLFANKTFDRVIDNGGTFDATFTDTLDDRNKGSIVEYAIYQKVDLSKITFSGKALDDNKNMNTRLYLDSEGFVAPKDLKLFMDTAGKYPTLFNADDIAHIPYQARVNLMDMLENDIDWSDPDYANGVRLDTMVKEYNDRGDPVLNAKWVPNKTYTQAKREVEQDKDAARREEIERYWSQVEVEQRQKQREEAWAAQTEYQNRGYKEWQAFFDTVKFPPEMDGHFNTEAMFNKLRRLWEVNGGGMSWDAWLAQYDFANEWNNMKPSERGERPAVFAPRMKSVSY